ncbi:hypothetical protein PMZ80_001422 [Knufia obscura]|uniref:Formamidopyrimidine-DNA glycosylase catalytic domain-containing protein n=2 Tax=Knufia TaxID=430999 RepID=A0AAN8IAY0_9EURO|nr:hypothetical protein PMZ80_001422 [Knufia obscura]KAK5956180.1 hypothetical protein OHC33_002754 [Knufia fluminis]
MPEIGEVARAVHYIRRHLVGKTLQKVTASEDGNVFGKVGTSHTEIMKKLTGKKVVDAGQQGKYFWMIMSSPPHPVMHFGMAGWLKFKNEHSFYYRKKDDEEVEDWPPKYCKVLFETDGKGEDKVEAAFVDLRRFARFRLVDCPGKDIRQHTPLLENGPDPVQDKDKVTVEWLTELCQRKKVPIKAMLLDQANISGIGNWVGDEIMYNAKMHPEQYANTLSDDEIKQLRKSIHYICGTAVELLADSDQFPEDWLFKHRWGKGKKDAPKTLPNGEKIVFLTVGGRTSAVIPSVQKKTGPVAKEMSDADEDEKPKKGKAGKKQKEKVTEDDSEEPKATKTKKRVKEETNDDDEESKATNKSKRVKKEDNEGATKPAPKKKPSGRKAAAEDAGDIEDVAETNGHAEKPTPVARKGGWKSKAEGAK